MEIIREDNFDFVILCVHGCVELGCSSASECEDVSECVREWLGELIRGQVSGWVVKGVLVPWRATPIASLGLCVPAQRSKNYWTWFSWTYQQVRDSPERNAHARKHACQDDKKNWSRQSPSQASPTSSQWSLPHWSSLSLLQRTLRATEWTPFRAAAQRLRLTITLASWRLAPTWTTVTVMIMICLMGATSIRMYISVCVVPV